MCASTVSKLAFCNLHYEKYIVDLSLSVLSNVHIFGSCRFNSLATVHEDDEESTTEVGSVMPDEAEAGPSREEVDAAIKLVC